MESQKNMTIDLHIKMLSIKVKEHTPVYVAWQRGNKKAKTKSRLLNEQVSQAIIDEKFQISTIMEVDAEGNPTKDKMSKLTIMGDKGKGILGEADLNLSQYQENEFKIMKLNLANCEDPEGYIEIGLRGVVAKEKEQKKVTNEEKDQIVNLLEELEREKKNTKKMKTDCEDKIKGLNEKINSLATSLQNQKTEQEYLSKQKVNWSNDKELAEKEIETLKRKIQQRDSDYQEKEYEAKKVKDDLSVKEDEKKIATLDVEAKKQILEKEVKDIQQQIERVREERTRLYQIDRFDVEFLSLVLLFNKDEDAMESRGIKV